MQWPCHSLPRNQGQSIGTFSASEPTRMSRLLPRIMNTAACVCCLLIHLHCWTCFVSNRAIESQPTWQTSGCLQQWQTGSWVDGDKMWVTGPYLAFKASSQKSELAVGLARNQIYAALRWNWPPISYCDSIALLNFGEAARARGTHHFDAAVVSAESRSVDWKSDRMWSILRITNYNYN